MIKQFAIFKVKEKKSDISPDYIISIKLQDKYLTIGGGWIKDGKGCKYISCKLSDGYKELKGFSITRDTDSSLTEEEKEKLAAIKAGVETKKEVEKSIDIDSIPF